tara:strand:+ start:52 stop:285 length:234 start_codon:yes stop_codon:yes gene_type:complete
MTEVVAKPVKINLRRDIKKMENELRDARRLMLTIRTKLQEAVIEANRSKTAMDRYTYKITRLEAAIHDRLKRIEDFL